MMRTHGSETALHDFKLTCWHRKFVAATCRERDALTGMAQASDRHTEPVSVEGLQKWIGAGC